MIPRSLQSNTNIALTAGTTVAVTLNLLGVGNLVRACVTYDDSGTIVTQVRDDLSRDAVFVARVHCVAAAQWIEEWCFIGHPGGNRTFTATFQNSEVGGRGICVVEVVGCDPVDPVGPSYTGHVEVGGTAPSAGPLVPQMDGSYLGGFCWKANTPPTADTANGWVQVFAEATLRLNGVEQQMRRADSKLATWTGGTDVSASIAVVYYPAMPPGARADLPPAALA